MPQYQLDSDELAMLAESSGRSLDQVLDHFGLGSGNQTVQPVTSRPAIAAPQTPPAPAQPSAGGAKPAGGGGKKPAGGGTPLPGNLTAAQRKKLQGLAPNQVALRLRKWGYPLSQEQQQMVDAIDAKRGKTGPSAGGPPAAQGGGGQQLPGTGGATTEGVPDGSHIAPDAVLGDNQVRVGDRVFTRGVSGKGNRILTGGDGGGLTGPSPEAVARQQERGGLAGGGYTGVEAPAPTPHHSPTGAPTSILGPEPIGHYGPTGGYTGIEAPEPIGHYGPPGIGGAPGGFTGIEAPDPIGHYGPAGMQGFAPTTQTPPTVPFPVPTLAKPMPSPGTIQPGGGPSTQTPPIAGKPTLGNTPPAPGRAPRKPIQATQPGQTAPTAPRVPFPAPVMRPRPQPIVDRYTPPPRR